ncbi:Protein kinase domain-containing protein [Geodermatophilus telluris]|uniref:non-specific serine/threonine protein kinase n=1 Tax=Geodermatophilus telluris TaxID=1190417 RepID=A0A1G6PL88_9ACTN|nr:DUF6777 domain-containing protein [Geodermatophilus telluris]SDC80125.1 Protein kinase domain-containing protein [Geodermatophilus telluris]
MLRVRAAGRRTTAHRAQSSRDRLLRGAARCAGARPAGRSATDTRPVRNRHSADDGATRRSGSPREVPLTGPTFGPYELDELLGPGRAGEVYRAWDTRRSRTVALEVVAPALSGDPRFRARFPQVCAAVAQLDEPHVLAVHEVGEVDGRLYVDAQLVDGRPLSAVLAAEGPLPAELAVDVVGQVAAALDAAHAAGLVHGDLRTADVLLSGHGDRPDVHLTGFGAAGTVDGTTDRRADVAALAALLHESLTGRPPGAAAQAGPLPGTLGAVVARGTAADPDRRFAGAGELATAARAALRPAPDTLPTPVAAAAPVAGAVAVAADVPAHHVARHRRPSWWARHRGGLVAALLAGVAALTAAGGVAAVGLIADVSDAATPTPVVVEPADEPGEAPFVPAPPDAAEPTAGAVGEAVPPGADAGTAAPAAAAEGTVPGDQPGLYGGAGAEACDPAGLAAFLTAHPDRGAAFAAVEGIALDEVDTYLASLTPVVLRFDTAVTNHGFTAGAAVPFPSVLQAGTAVLVDDSGVPQVRCICGNPLAPPVSRPSADHEGETWPGYAAAAVVVVERSVAPLPALVLVDAVTGTVVARPVRTTGGEDQPVGAVLAELARVFTGDPTPSPSSGATTSAVPPPAAASGGAGTATTVPPAPDTGTASPSADAPPTTGGSTSRGTTAPGTTAPGTTSPGTTAPGTTAPGTGTTSAPAEPPADEPPAAEVPDEEPAPEPVEEQPAAEVPDTEEPAPAAVFTDAAPTAATTSAGTPTETTATEVTPSEAAPTETAATETTATGTTPSDLTPSGASATP